MMRKALSLLLEKPLLLAVAASLLILALIVGVAVLTLLKLWTGVVLGGFLLVVSWTLLQTKALPTEKYPWITFVLIFLPVFGFFFGVWSERTGAFYVTPLMMKPEPVTPYYAAEPLQTVAGNIEILMIFTLMICIAVAFARAKG